MVFFCSNNCTMVNAKINRNSTSAAAAAQNMEDEEYPESYSRLVEQLEKFFSQDISIKRSKNGGGRIVIGFGDDKDIEQFIERFSGRIK